MKSSVKSLLFLICNILWINNNAFCEDDFSLIIQSGHRKSSRITAIACHPNKHIFASGADDRLVKLWDSKSGKLINTFSQHEGPIINMAFSITGDTLVTLAMDNKIRLWDTKSGEIIRVFSDEGFYPTAGVFHPESRIMISSGRRGSDGYIKIRDIVNQETIFNAERENYPKELLISKNGDVFAAIENDRYVYIWDLTESNPYPKFKLSGFESKAEGISISGNGIIAGIDDSSNIVLWDMTSKEIIRKFNFKSKGISISPDGKLLATRSPEGDKIYIINSIAGNIEREFHAPENSGLCLAFTRDSDFLISGGESGVLTRWNIAAGKNAMEYKGIDQSITATALSDDGTTGAFVISKDSHKNYLLIYNFEVNIIEDVALLPLPVVNSVNFRNNSADIAVCGMGFLGRSIYIYNGRTKKLEEFPMSCGSVNDAAFSLNGDLFAIATEDSLKIIDMVNKTLVAQTNSPAKAKITNIDFNPNNESITYSCHNGKIVNYDYENYKSDTLFSNTNGNIVLLQQTINDNNLYILTDIGNAYIWNNDNRQKSYKVELKSENKISRALVASEKLFVATRDRNIRIYSISDSIKLIIEFSHDHTAISSDIHFINEKNLLLTAGTEGLIKLWEISSPENFMQLFVSNEYSWAAASSYGFFDGTVAGMRHLHWSKGYRTSELEVYFDRYFQPDLLQIMFDTGFDLSDKPLSDAVAGYSLPPQIEFAKDIYIDSSSTDQYELIINLNSPHSPLSQLLIYNNSKLVKSLEYTSNQISRRREIIKINLLPGENEIKAKAYSTDSLHSNIIIRNVFCTIEPEKPDLYLLAIGINEYGRRSLDLKYAVSDVNEFSGIISNKNLIYENIHIYKLLDHEATKDGVLQAFTDIKDRTKLNDSFIFLFAGHGATHYSSDSSNAYFNFFLYDRSEEYKHDNPEYRLSSEEIGKMIVDIKASKQVMIIDACQSADMIDNIYWQIKENSMQKKSIARISDKYGLNIFTSALSSKPAYENGNLQHGLFTYVLLHGLKGEAAFGDNSITIGELKLFIDKELPKLAKEQKLEQYPYTRLDGADFEIKRFPELSEE